MTPFDALKERILAAARDARAPGLPVDAEPPMTGLEAFAAAIDQLSATLRSLSPTEWLATAHPDHGSVRDLIAHLAGVERLSLTWVTASPDEPPVPSDHFDATRALTRDLVGCTPSDVAAAWADAAWALHAACAASDPAKPILAHDLPTDVEGLLVLRSFELWTHLEDVCRATGRPMPDVEDARLRFMSTRFMGIVPLAFVWRGVDAPLPAIRFVLTGPGGACHDVPLLEGAEVDEATPTVIAPTVDMCRLAARRLTPDELSATIDGDEDAVTAVLAELDAFARD